MIEVNHRDTILIVAALGLFATALSTPAAAADEPDRYCLPLALGEHDVGPATVDARNTCPSVTVTTSQDCDVTDPSASEVEDCVGAVDDAFKTDVPPIVCLYPFGC